MQQNKPIPDKKSKKPRQTVTPTTPAEPLTPPMPPVGVPFINIAPGQCRSIIGQWDGLALYCGEPTVASTSWCKDHLRIYYTGRGAWGRA